MNFSLLGLFRQFFVCLLFLFSGVPLAKPLEVIIPPPHSEKDLRNENVVEVLRTALEKTVESDGPFILRTTAKHMNQRRYKHEFLAGREPNLIWAAASNEMEAQARSIPIPVFKGLLGYRVFLIHEKDQAKFSEIETVEELKKLYAGHEATWVDTDILRENGFNLVLGFDYEGLFLMLKLNRFDYFPRGVIEVRDEIRARRTELTDVVIEKSILLYYPYPNYFYVMKENEAIADRISRGLEIMIDDGSFDAIALKYNGEDIRELGLNQRKVFRIPNPLLPGNVPYGRKELWFNFD